MEYIYAAMLLHKAGKKIDEASLRKVLDAAGVKAEEVRVKAIVAALEGVNIDEAIKSAHALPVAAAPAAHASEKGAEKKEEKKKEEDSKKSEEAASAGLSALFG